MPGDGGRRVTTVQMWRREEIDDTIESWLCLGKIRAKKTKKKIPIVVFVVMQGTRRHNKINK